MAKVLYFSDIKDPLHQVASSLDIDIKESESKNEEVVLKKILTKLDQVVKDRKILTILVSKVIGYPGVLDSFLTAVPEKIKEDKLVIDTLQLLYAMCYVSDQKKRVGLRLIKKLADGRDVTAVLNFLNHIKGQPDLVDPQMYLIAYQSLNESHPLEAFESLLKYVTNVVSQDKEPILNLIRLSIQLPQVLNFDQILPLPALQAVKTNPLYTLLTIFATKEWKDYVAFYEKNKNVFTLNKLSYQDNLEKMKLLSLATLASQNIGKQVSYQTIADTLDVPQHDVEMFLLDAVRASILSCKMDQEKATVLMTKATPRSFGTNEWKLLETRVQSLIKSLEPVQKSIERMKQHGPSSVVYDYTRKEREQRQKERLDKAAADAAAAGDDASNVDATGAANKRSGDRKSSSSASVKNADGKEEEEEIDVELVEASEAVDALVEEETEQAEIVGH